MPDVSDTFSTPTGGQKNCEKIRPKTEIILV